MTAALQFASTRMETDSPSVARGLRQRDPDLLDTLIERYQHRLFRYLLYLTRNRPLAEDLFQETWLRVLERGSQYNPRYRFEAWLLTIARNLAFDRLRRPRVSEAMSEETTEEDGWREPASPEASPFDAAERSEQAARLAAALAHIPAYYREALTLRFHEDFSLQEIAQITGVPLSTAKSRLRRGMEMLQRHWQESGA